MIDISTASERGKQSEDQALSFLEKKGLILMRRNYRTRSGEIDLIMEDNQVTVFIEVRYRSSSDFLDTIETIDKKSLKK